MYLGSESINLFVHYAELVAIYVNVYMRLLTDSENQQSAHNQYRPVLSNHNIICIHYVCMHSRTELWPHKSINIYF